MDTDVISTKPLPHIKEFVAVVQDDKIGSAVIRMGRQHPFLQLLLERFVSDKNKDANIGFLLLFLEHPTLFLYNFFSSCHVLISFDVF